MDNNSRHGQGTTYEASTTYGTFNIDKPKSVNYLPDVNNVSIPEANKKEAQIDHCKRADEILNQPLGNIQHIISDTQSFIKLGKAYINTEKQLKCIFDDKMTKEKYSDILSYQPSWFSSSEDRKCARKLLEVASRLHDFIRHHVNIGPWSSGPYSLIFGRFLEGDAEQVKQALAKKCEENPNLRLSYN